MNLSKLLLLSMFILVQSNCLSQPTVKTVPLRGIIVDGDFLKDTYFYGTKKLNSAYDLTIPFMEIEDKEVARLYRSYKTIQQLRSLVVIAPTMYFVYTLGSNSRNIPNTYNPQVGWSIFVTSVAASIGLGIWGRVRIKKAINRYNELILNDNTPQSFQPIPSMNLVSIGWKYKF